MKTILPVLLTIAVMGVTMAPVMGQEKKNIFLQNQNSDPFKTGGAFSYTFSKTTGNYQDLTGVTSLNNNQTWDDPEYIVPMDFPFTMFGLTIDSLSFDFSTGGCLGGFSASNTTAYIPGICPFEVDLIDRGDLTGISQSPLSYKVDGVVGNRILKVEWNNVGSYDDSTLNDYVNFQMWLYEGSGNIEFHFGASSIADNDVFFVNQGPIVGIMRHEEVYFDFTDLHMLQGASANPTMVSTFDPWFPPILDGVPGDGTIYKFSNQVSGLNRPKTQEMFRAYPNPVSGMLALDWEGKDILGISLYNAMGQRVYGEKISPNSSEHKLDLSGFTPGLYHLNVQTSQGNVAQTIIKE